MSVLSINMQNEHSGKNKILQIDKVNFSNSLYKYQYDVIVFLHRKNLALFNFCLSFPDKQCEITEIRERKKPQKLFSKKTTIPH